MQGADAIFDLPKCLVIVERVDIDISDIPGAQSLSDTHFHLLAIVAAEDRVLTNGVRSKTSTGTESHEAIERDAQNSQVDLCISDFIKVRQTTEGRETADRGLIERVGRSRFLFLFQRRAFLFDWRFQRVKQWKKTQFEG